MSVTLENFGAHSQPNPLPIAPHPVAPGEPSLVATIRPDIHNDNFPFPAVRTLRITLNASGTGRVDRLRVQAVRTINGEDTLWLHDSAANFNAPLEVRQAIAFPPEGITSGKSFEFHIGRIPSSGAVEYRIYASGDAGATIDGAVSWDPRSI